VRRAVAAALGAFPPTAATSAALGALGCDASYFVVADALASLGATRASGAFSTLLSRLDTPSWQDTIAAGALRGLAELGDERAVVPFLACLADDRPPSLRARFPLLFGRGASAPWKHDDLAAQPIFETGGFVHKPMIRSDFAATARSPQRQTRQGHKM